MTQVVRRRLEFEQDPELFMSRYAPKQQALADKILAAQQLLPEVTYENDILMMAVSLSIALGVDGHRADITMLKTAMTLAAFEGRSKVSPEDLKQSAVLVLPHRMRKTPFDSGVLDQDAIEEILRNNG